jgi:hypothetical protein
MCEETYERRCYVAASERRYRRHLQGVDSIIDLPRE